MGTGVVEKEKAARWISLRDVSGDYAEIGVYAGRSFVHFARAVAAEGHLAHAFDSFVGLAEPGPFDDAKRYHRGRFAVGGVEGFDTQMQAVGLPRLMYKTWPGYVPHCFKGAEDLRFALAYIDLDHYAPTVQAIPWVAERILPGGLLGFDDYFDFEHGMASRAINEWQDGEQGALFTIVENDNNQLLLRRT